MYELNFPLVRIEPCRWDVMNPGCAVISVKNAFPIRIRMAATPYPLRRPLRLSACADDALASQNAALACAGMTACVSAQTARHTRGQWRCPHARGLQSTSVRPYWPKFPSHSWSTKMIPYFRINGCHKSSLTLKQVACPHDLNGLVYGPPSACTPMGPPHLFVHHGTSCGVSSQVILGAALQQFWQRKGGSRAFCTPGGRHPHRGTWNLKTVSSAVRVCSNGLAPCAAVQAAVCASQQYTYGTANALARTSVDAPGASYLDPAVQAGGCGCDDGTCAPPFPARCGSRQPDGECLDVCVARHTPGDHNPRVLIFELCQKDELMALETPRLRCAAQERARRLPDRQQQPPQRVYDITGPDRGHDLLRLVQHDIHVRVPAGVLHRSWAHLNNNIRYLQMCRRSPCQKTTS